MKAKQLAVAKVFLFELPAAAFFLTGTFEERKQDFNYFY